jgi:hypothetical protein
VTAVAVNLDKVDADIRDLEKQLAKERTAEEKFRTDLTKKIGKLETQTDELVKRVPARTKSAYHDLAIRVVQVFSFTFIASFIPLVSGLGAFPDMVTAKAAAWSAAVAAMAAVLKIVQGSLTTSEAPFPGKGVAGTPTD